MNGNYSVCNILATLYQRGTLVHSFVTPDERKIAISFAGGVKDGYTRELGIFKKNRQSVADFETD